MQLKLLVSIKSGMLFKFCCKGFGGGMHNEYDTLYVGQENILEDELSPKA